MIVLVGPVSTIFPAYITETRVTQLRHGPNIMADKDQSEPHISLQHLEKIQVLGLDGYVQRSCRLVGNQDSQVIAGKGDRSSYPLAHASTHLVRVLVDQVLRRGNAYPLQQLYNLLLKPESTEGGRRGSVLKWPEGAPVNLR